MRTRGRVVKFSVAAANKLHQQLHLSNFYIAAAQLRILELGAATALQIFPFYAAAKAATTGNCQVLASWKFLELKEQIRTETTYNKLPKFTIQQQIKKAKRFA